MDCPAHRLGAQVQHLVRARHHSPDLPPCSFLFLTSFPPSPLHRLSPVPALQDPADPSFLPIVLLALVFNLSNVVGFSYADRDAQKRWANAAAGSNIFGGMGGIGGQLVGGLVRNSVGRFFR